MYSHQWIKKDINDDLVKSIADKYSCGFLTAHILVNRGITTDSEIKYFLSDDINLLCDPFLLPDINKAMQRIQQARARKEKILIFGDRDVDGITATTLLVDYLQCLDIAVSWRIPVRDESYGLSIKAVEDFSAEDGNLIITVDCGISNIAEITRANELGIDVIVTDHHTPKDILPEAFAIVNPKLKDSVYPFSDIAGCMVAYKLILALQKTLGNDGIPDYSRKDRQYIQLTALGTVADIVPLLNENRIIVRNGLKAIIDKPRYGLSELLITLGLAGKRITAKELGWLLCPVINAAGRMGCPDKALNLLLEADPLIRINLAREIKLLNDRRRRLGAKSLPFIEQLAKESLHQFDGKLVVAAGENISRGITGIMANRLTERFNIPAMVVHLGNEIAIGSIRSTGNYDIRLLIEPIDDILLNWGGHKNALGFSLDRSLWEQFIDRLEIEICYIPCVYTPENEPVIIDAEISPSNITPNILAIVDLFDPYGTGNEPLVFVSNGIKVINAYLFGKTEMKHLKMTFETKTYQWSAILWNATNNIDFEIRTGDTVDAVFSFERDSYYKRETQQIVIKDMKK